MFLCAVLVFGVEVLRIECVHEDTIFLNFVVELGKDIAYVRLQDRADVVLRQLDEFFTTFFGSRGIENAGGNDIGLG